MEFDRQRPDRRLPPIPTTLPATQLQPSPRGAASLLRMAVVQGLVARNPVSATRRRDTGKRIPYLFDLHDAKRLLGLASEFPDRSRAPHRAQTYEMIFALLYGLGLRVGEAVRLHLRDV